MRKIDIELIVGLFLLIGIIAMSYISVKLGKMEWVGGGGYQVTAVFSSAGGLKVGAVVEIAGVEGRPHHRREMIPDVHVKIEISIKAQYWFPVGLVEGKVEFPVASVVSYFDDETGVVISTDSTP